MLNQRLAQKLQQKLSPQQIQLMKLLQVPTANLEQRIKEELESNPALETGSMELSENSEKEDTLDKEEEEIKEAGETDEIDVSEYLSDDEVADYKYQSNQYSADEEEKSIPIRVKETFHEYLEKQLSLVDLKERQYKIAEQIIGSIDEDGYLRRALQSIADDLAFTQNIETDEEEIKELLGIIQRFDPAGIGARNLQESLLLQLERKRQSPPVRLAYKIIRDHFEAFSKKHYEKLMKALDIEDDELKIAIGEILKLNPKPGIAYNHDNKSNQNQYIIPDFIIKNKEGELELQLNNANAPELHISRDYQNMLRGYKESKKKSREQKQAVMFIKQKIDAAKWFIDAIRQRQHTLYNTMHAIMDYQREFFLTGDEAKLRPMILKDIADIIHMDISTVSRVANSKYVQTEFGTFPLKYFFSESLTNEEGEEVSTREVKSILKNLIEKEDKRKPLSDQKLMEELKKRGYNIARRTVAKYREQLNIPVARLRKEL